MDNQRFFLRQKSQKRKDGKNMKIPEMKIIAYGTWHNHRKLTKTKNRFVLNYELEVHHEGGSAYINDIPYHLEPGDIIFSAPGDTRFSAPPSATDYIYFDFVSPPPESFQKILHLIPHYCPSMPEIKHLIEAFAYHYEKTTLTSPYQLQLLLLSMLLSLAESNGELVKEVSKPSKHQAMIFKSVCFMRDHLSDDISVKDMADYIGYSTSHFNYIFKSYIGTAPYAYYISLKMHEAKHLLATTQIPITQIAEQLAFHSVSDFSYFFRKVYHQTPSQFRKTHSEFSYFEED